MAERNPLLQPASGKSGMEFRAQLYRSPLLPFERQIIELIGCTEEEYRFLVTEAIWRGRTRPAGYEHIPDVRMDPLTVAIIGIAVGVASSAAAYFLAPKPKALPVASQAGAGSNQQVTNQQLDSINGAARFSPTFGFDSQAQLATYGDPIPVIFGRYTGSTGGMLVSPKLVWSRMFSYGSQQGVKLLFIVGEQGYDGGQTPQGLAQPSLGAIFLGNTPLDAIYANEFAFYWRRNTTLSGTGRILADHLRYGTRATAASGDPETFYDVFSCPTAKAEDDYGFSSSHSLSNNRSFGCYNSIPNGTGYRVNWRVVSIPEIGNTYENDPKATLTSERNKIAGISRTNFTSDEEYRDIIRLDGMGGVGRNWSRRMGVISYNGQRVPAGEGRRAFTAAVGGRIVFKISAKQLRSDFFGNSGVKVDDINSALNEERVSADDGLQIGEIFMIADTVWKVIDRRIAQWRPEDGVDQLATLECIEITGPSRIGVVAEEALEADYLWDRFPNEFGMDTDFFPLHKVSFATIRNTRPCEVTEIGIKSRVFQRLNGICNFQSLPSPTELNIADRDKVNLQSGTISTYVRRASAFTIHVRPADFQQGTTTPFAWVPIGENFVVVGNQPVDLYNFLRIRHPAKYRLEFRLIPKNGADLSFNDPATAQYWQLNANASVQNAGERSILSSTYNTTYGPFTISGVGTIVTKSAIASNAEFTAKPVLSRQNFTATIPQQISAGAPLPENNGISEAVTATQRGDYVIQPNAGYPSAFRVAFAFELFGSADDSPLAEGSIGSRVVRHSVTGNRWIEIRYSYIKLKFSSPHWSGQSYCWRIDDHTVVASSNDWGGVTEFSTWTEISGLNPFRTPPGYPSFEAIGEYHKIIGTTEGPIGRTQAFLEEIHGPARDQNIGFQKTTTFSYSASGKQVTLRVTSTVAFVEYHWSGVTRQWSGLLVQVDTSTPTNTTNWVIGDRFRVLRTVSSTNPFFQPGQQVGYEFVVNSITVIPTGFTESITAERQFELQSQYADISFYGSLVDKSNSNNAEHSIAYVNEITSNPTSPNYDRLTVCGLALKASRNFTGLDQLRVWLPTGIPVIRFHPDDGGTLDLTDPARLGPSNLFTDLVYYLLTDPIAGMGKVLGITPTDPQLINTNDLVTTAKFLKANKLFYDGALTSSTNLRQFIADRAPYFLCNFVISDGKFSLLPAVPITVAGEISVEPVQIQQLFTSGNIIEDSFTLEYVPAEERKSFQAVVRFREESQNQLPQERNIVVRWADDNRYAAVESFDLTDYCTSYQHAELVGRFLLSIRKRITHTISFKTLPYGINLAPGDYIRVVTEASPYSAALNGSINDRTGVIVSATEIPDGRYTILYYLTGAEDVSEGIMTVSNGTVLETELYGAIFTIFDVTVSENVYMVEQLTLDEEGTVQVTASEFPCDSRRSSLLAQDLLPQNRGRFVVEI